MSHVEDRRKHKDGASRLPWRARYTDLDGRQRARSFATKGLAERFLREVQKAQDSGTWRDPDSGNITLGRYAAEWLDAQGFDAVTREAVEVRLRIHILPLLGDKRLAELAGRPSLIQAWVNGLPLAPSTARKVFTHLNSILLAALKDSLIDKNPCAGTKLPPVSRRRIEPWTLAQADAVRLALPPRLRAMVDAGTGLGERQSELFALSAEQIDWLHRQVHVQQQVKLVGGRLTFAAPKGARVRTVPLAAQVAEALAAHLAEFPAVPVTLPWHDPRDRARHGKPHTAALLFTRVIATGSNYALHRAAFNSHVWRPAVKAAGLGDRGNGCHMMRHCFASTLIARGVDVRTVAEFLGHGDGGALVLKTYSHLMPDAAERARKALESALSASPAVPMGYLEGGNRS